MRDQFASFDDIRNRVTGALSTMPAGVFCDAGRIYLVRDLRGRIRLSMSDETGASEPCRAAAEEFACKLHKALGPHGYPADKAVLVVDAEVLQGLEEEAQEVGPGVYLTDRLVIGRGWWTVRSPVRTTSAARYTLYSVKGGVGRSTTAAILAWHLASAGEHVLVVDLDLESPGLSSAMLDPSATRSSALPTGSWKTW